MNELEKNKRDLNVLYDFAVEHAEQCNLTIEDTIQCNFDRLNKALADYDKLKKEVENLRKNIMVCNKCGNQVSISNIDSTMGEIWYCYKCEKEVDITTLSEWKHRKGVRK